MKSIQENGLDSLREEVRKRVGCAAIFTRQDSQTKVSKLIGHQDEKVYFCVSECDNYCSIHSASYNISYSNLK